MFCHEVHEFFIAQVSSCDVLLIRRLLGADYLMRPQSGTMQEFAEFLFVERFTDVVHTLKFHAFFSQEPLDLAAGTSGWFLVQHDLALDGRHGLLPPDLLIGENVSRVCGSRCNLVTANTIGDIAEIVEPSRLVRIGREWRCGEAYRVVRTHCLLQKSGNLQL
jgi:hypothetical protein